jgi:hypothetical protein
MPAFKISQNTNFVLKTVFFLIGVQFLISCSVSPQQKPETKENITPPSTYAIPPVTLPPEEIFTPTANPTQTSTPVPALIAHEWVPSEPLIAFGGSGGDGGCGFEGTLPFHFTLLSNGELYILDWSDDVGAYQFQTAVLTRQNTCNLLNSIDQAGFFDYDSSTYINEPNWDPPIQGAGRAHISVQAWESNSVDLYGLGAFINQENEIRKSWDECDNCPELQFPTILPSIRKTYQILANYDVSNLEIYQPTRIGLWVDAYADMDNAVVWPMKSVKLAQIVSLQGHIDDNPNIILTGADAKEIYKLFNESINTCGISVTEGEKTYRVFARPLLPTEYLEEPLALSATLSCAPSDGWMEIP